MVTTFVICSISVLINASGIPWYVKADTRGKILNESTTKYLVDFTEGVKGYALEGKPSDYNKVLVDKKECVKE